MHKVSVKTHNDAMTLGVALSEENSGRRIRGDSQSEQLVGRPHSFLLKFDIIVQHDMRHHSLELVRGEEASGAVYTPVDR